MIVLQKTSESGISISLCKFRDKAYFLVNNEGSDKSKIFPYRYTEFTDRLLVMFTLIPAKRR